jgi:hypothetical protein
MTIANTAIQLKKSGVSGNSPSNLNYGELAINYADGKLYYQTLSGVQYLKNSQSFATVNANSSLILATSPTDILTFSSGGGITVTGNTTSKTISLASVGYQGALAPFSTNTLTASNFGYVVQLSANATLPLASSMPAGSKINFYSQGTYTISVANPGAGEFIYSGSGSIAGTSTRTITLYEGETIELTTRGSVEWDITGGTGGLKYQPKANVYSIAFADGTVQYTANAGTGGGGTDTWARSAANSASSYANSAYLTANSASINATNAGSYANSAYLTANSALGSTTNLFGITAWQNTAIATAGTNANTGIQYGTSAGSYANSAYLQSNAHNTFANATFLTITNGTIIGSYANSAYLQANAAYVSQNTTGVYANTALQYANSASSYSNSAYALANASASFANTTFFTKTGGTISGSISVIGDVNVTGNINYTGNVTTQHISGNTGEFFGYSSNGFNSFYAGVPTGFSIVPNEVAQYTGSNNSYVQINFQNENIGSQATTDWVATAGNGSDTTYYVDLGIAGSGYNNTNPNNSLGTSLLPNDAYLYAQGNTSAGQPGGNLVIGTTTTNTTVRVIAGGINSQNVVTAFAPNTQFLYVPLTFADGTTQNSSSISAGTYANAAYTRANSSVMSTGGVVSGTLQASALSSNSGVVIYSSGTVMPGSLVAGNLYANTVTSSAGITFTVDTFATSSYRSATYEVTMGGGGAATPIEWHTITIKVLHDGTNVYMSQYGEMFTSVSLGSFDASIASGTLSLKVTPTTGLGFPVNIAYVRTAVGVY